ncbi:surfeit locus protein 6-domain-containing protein [Alternaria rosae]|uniref:surfeit locus protein 6-domain-containing protein n=1 Tax=Alternaria rosae TaxID=1187941 RepID=UPI001E8D8354|nr:surfeit locus protein 6-domain-containing protein [Alternaria rosae]XP_046021711.1 surfeit locus protein 6-domain-containing protein [Alternaria rosae]KAH6843508.1 surfeit locus protein 6-domain-containing protein [Alternaria rosae]KAH6864765.1 surfeit locus protein 6-domain-containing protein [Alternaria rosae]
MGDNLEERLKSHARAFEGLMSLIPAKDYYGKDESITSTQWQKKGKKQTLEERQAAKRAKLDPASHKSAKDVMDENALKRKRELEGEEVSEPESSDLDMDITKEKPLEGIKSKAKKQKTQPVEPEVEETEEVTLSKAEAKHAAKAEKRREKRKEKQAKNKQKMEAKKALPTQFQGLAAEKPEKDEDEDEDEDEEDDDSADELEHPDERIEALDVSGLVEEGQSTAPSTTANSNSSTASVASAASSNSSLPQSGEEAPQKKAKKPYTIDPQKHEDFRARLNAKLEAMRAARKADGPDGRPARNRAELIEARRKKEAEKKAAKKAMRQDAKEDEARQQAEEQLARIRGGSGSPSVFPARSPETERNFNFGKIAWDGQQLESNLSGFLDSKKKKGKSDAKTALEAAQKKQARINAFDEDKRKDIQEKDLWLAAKKRAQGEKVFDDVNLLKKSLKRQQKQKDKSKQEWKERLTNVDQGKAARQKKREENLKKRKEDKGQKGKKKVKKPGKKVKRPGFEGTFKAR